MDQAVSFTCNVCGLRNQAAAFRSEPATCSCGSNVRVRALIYLLSMELFGRSLAAADFPRLKSIRGLGMTDKPGYAVILEDKFDYTNTYYDREPRFDFTEAHPELYGSYDFILSADVLEHIAPPVERAMAEIASFLKPNGFLAATVPCTPDEVMREHFPQLGEYRVIRLGKREVLVNRRPDGSLEAREDLVFHEGPGEVLEMRQFGLGGLREKLVQAGFRDAFFLLEDLPEAGILFDRDVSQPLIARKEPFRLSLPAERELLASWVHIRHRAYILSERIRMASESRWVRIGRKLGIGPDFES